MVHFGQIVGIRKESNSNKPMHSYYPIPPIYTQIDITIPTLGKMLAQNNRREIKHFTINIPGCPLNRAHPAKIADLIIAFVADNGSPFFAHSITSSATRLARLAALSSIVSNAVSSPFGATP